MLLRLCLILSMATTPAFGQAPPTTLPATIPTTQPVLTGRWRVVVTPAEPSRETTVQPSDHTLVFDNERLQIIGALGEQFRSTPYEYRPPDFRAVFDRPEAGNAIWAGEITEHEVIRGMILWTRRDGTLEIYHFAGEPERDQTTEPH